MTNLNEAIDKKTFDLMVKEKRAYIDIIEKAKEQGILESFNPTEEVLRLLKLDEFTKLNNYIKIGVHYLAVIRYDPLGDVTYAIATEKSFKAKGCDDKGYAKVTVDIDNMFDRTIKVEHKTNYLYHPNGYISNNNGNIPARYKFKYDKDILLGAAFYEQGTWVAPLSETIEDINKELESVSRTILNGRKKINELKKEIEKIEMSIRTAIHEGELIKNNQSRSNVDEKERCICLFRHLQILERCADYIENVYRLNEASKKGENDIELYK